MGIRIVGNAVQIGLFETCEYQYLTNSNWRNMSQDNPLKQLPPCFNSEYYHYIGLDKEPNNTKYCSKNYSNERTTFITAKIVTMSDLKNSLTSLDIDAIDVLAVDIEGYEKTLFANDWHIDMIPVKFIAVEYHPQFTPGEFRERDSIHDFSQNFSNIGYKLYREEVTNRGSTAGLTIEQQWLKG